MSEPRLTETHEPTVRELAIELEGLRDMLATELRAVREQRKADDRLYSAREDASKAGVTAAFLAAQTQTKQAFASSEAARNKVESTQERYNTEHNAVLKVAADRARETLGECKELINALRVELRKDQTQSNRWLVSTLIGIVGAAAGAGLVISFKN